MASSLRHRVVGIENNNFEDTNNNTLPNVMNNQKNASINNHNENLNLILGKKMRITSYIDVIKNKQVLETETVKSENNSNESKHNSK